MIASTPHLRFVHTTAFCRTERQHFAMSQRILTGKYSHIVKSCSEPYAGMRQSQGVSESGEVRYRERTRNP